jgi:hypothetical protein
MGPGGTIVSVADSNSFKGWWIALRTTKPKQKPATSYKGLRKTANIAGTNPQALRFQECIRTALISVGRRRTSTTWGNTTNHGISANL